MPPFFLRAQAFHLPSDGSAPLILVGTGTGIAPLRSFWQQRVSDMNNKSPPKSAITGRRQWGDIRLFFGCRNPFLDDIYRNEIEEAVRSKVLRSVATAYSREKGKPKQYVQDLLRKDSADLCDLILNRHAHVYVCGAADMAKGVYETIQVNVTLASLLYPGLKIEIFNFGCVKKGTRAWKDLKSYCILKSSCEKVKRRIAAMNPFHL